MNNPVKAALILAAAIIVVMGLWIYFSPYQSCLRSLAGENVPEAKRAVICGQLHGKN